MKLVVLYVPAVPLVMVMLSGRFLPTVVAIALAGSLSRGRVPTSPPSSSAPSPNICPCDNR
jgi:K+-transporting ATPase A subunit